MPHQGMQASILLSTSLKPRFQTHIDIIEDFDQELLQQLQTLSQKHDFMLFEDRKFADIGHSPRR